MKAQLVAISFIAFVLSLLVACKANGQSREDITQIIRESAIRHRVDPTLAVAIATVESGLNPKAVGTKGELGVFQLRPEYHAVRAGDVINNVEVAIVYLAEIKCKWEPVYGDAWFIKYNLGPNYRRLNHPALFPYYRKVMSARTIASH